MLPKRVKAIVVVSNVVIFIVIDNVNELLLAMTKLEYSAMDIFIPHSALQLAHIGISNTAIEVPPIATASILN